MINFFKRLLNALLLSRKQLAAEDPIYNKNADLNQTGPYRGDRPSDYEPVGKYFKHNITNNYIYIHSPVGKTFEIVEADTINQLNDLTLERILRQMMTSPTTTNFESYHYYPRTCMGTITEEELDTYYKLVDIYTVDPHYLIFVNSCIETLDRIKELKAAAIEELKFRPAVINPVNLSNSILLDPILNINPLSEDQEKQLSINRFDKID